MYLHQYLEIVHDNQLMDSISKTSTNISENVNRNFDFLSHINGLLLGNVQSGKTAQMLGAIARFADQNYKIFIVLTADNIDLQRQTYDRILHALPFMNVLSERDEVRFRSEGLLKPCIIVLKKNRRVLQKWRDLLLATRICNGRPLLIFDDEADAASLNTLINKKRTSTINGLISEIKRSATASVYFEVTATPQAILLQSSLSGWAPSFVNYFEPGEGYLGGNFFYSDPKSYCIRYTEENELDDVVDEGDCFCPIGLRRSLLSFLIVCAYKKIKGETNCNFLIHPSVRINIHDVFANRVEEYLNLLQNSTSEKAFDINLLDAWLDLQQTKPDLINYQDIKETVIELLDNTEIFIVILNSKNLAVRDIQNPNALNLSNGFNIIIGGNTLGRGITFPHLQTVYYCRTSKTPQADTFWQHSRIFGYDREKELIRIFVPQVLYKLFVDLNRSNEILLSQIKQDGLSGVQLVYSEKIKPTRMCVLDNDFLNVVVGGVNMFASNPWSHTEVIDKYVEYYLGAEYSDVTPDIILELLTFVGSLSSLDFDCSKFSNCLKALQSKKPRIKCKLIIRIDRDISKGTGTLLSPNDRKLSDKFNDAVVLTLYRVNGTVEKGWSGQPLWIPNIRFPDKCYFYDIE